VWCGMLLAGSMLVGVQSMLVGVQSMLVGVQSMLQLIAVLQALAVLLPGCTGGMRTWAHFCTV
jgi:hypothetical protein